MTRPAAVLGVALTLAGALVGSYAALGGTSYRPTPVADPCKERGWPRPAGVSEALERVALATADVAACSLGVSREDLVLALASRDDLRRFAATHHLTEDDAARAVRDGLDRVVSEAERAGAVTGALADGLRFVARHLPIEAILDALRGAASLAG